MKLYLRVREEIINGTYPYGTKAPSRRTLAENTGTSLATVDHAYSMLAEEGYIEAKERSGWYVTYRVGDGWEHPSEEAPRLQKRADPVKAGDFPFSALAKTMRSVITREGRRLLEPSPPQGEPALREALASYLARSRGVRVDPSHIWIGSGAEYLYGLTIQALGRNRIYALEDPSYAMIEKTYAAQGARVEKLRLGREGIETEELLRSKASVIHVTPVGSFPSGITASASKRQEYLLWAKKRNGIIVEDDYKSELTLLSKPEDTLFSLAKGETVIYMNTFSETLTPSLRMGYMVLPPKLVSLFNEKVGFYTCPVPVFEQLVLADFMNSGRFERYINKERRLLRKAAKERNQ